MKKIFLTGLSVILLLTVISCQSFSQQKVKVKVKVENNDDEDGNWSYSRNGHAPGEWDAIIKDDVINIQFYGKDWNNGRNFPLAEFGALPTDKIGEFNLNRESGKMNFKGVFLNHFGHGTYTFEENTPFKAYLQQKGYTGLDDELMMSIFFTDISKSYFEFLKENGYANVSNGQLRDLAEQNLTRKVFEEYLALCKAHSWGHPSLDKIVELREHGVNARFVNSFAQMGYKENIPMDKALELRDHGVSPEFITSIQKMGYGEMTLDKATELRDHGVNPEFIESIQKMGYGKLTLDKAEELRDHGVNPEFIKSIAALGFKDLTLDKAQELRDHGVNAEFIKNMRNKGVKVETLDDFIRLRDTGFSE
jgi:hypothetical protein